MIKGIYLNSNSCGCQKKLLTAAKVKPKQHNNNNKQGNISYTRWR